MSIVFSINFLSCVFTCLLFLFFLFCLFLSFFENKKLDKNTKEKKHMNTAGKYNVAIFQ